MEPIGQHLASLAASKQHLTQSSINSTESKKLALYHAKLILGCYRTDDVSDPQVFVTGVATVLSRYAADVGARLSDPKDGIAGRIKWLPTISEIREECDRLTAADMAAAKRRADLAEQWRLRDEMEGGTARVELPAQGTVYSNYDEAVAKHGRPTGVFEGGRQLPYRG